MLVALLYLCLLLPVHLLKQYLTVLEDEQVIISTNRGEPLTLSDGRSPAKKCYLNVSQRLTNKDVPIIDLKKEGKSLKDKFMRLMQTKVF